MIAAVLHLVAGTGLLASKSDPPAWLLLSGPAGGGGFYYFLYRYYRNPDQKHSFERETRVASKPVTGTDAKVDEVKGTRKRHVDGDNRSDHRQRVQRIG